MNKKPILLATLLNLVLAVAVYYLSLRFIHPGYFSPLAPHHSDFYWVPGIAYDLDNFDSYISGVRPAGYLVLFLAGKLGLQGYIFSFAVVSLLTSALTISLVNRVTSRPVPVFLSLVYLLHVFSHPYFYLNYVYDGFATLSLFYLLVTLHCWYAFRENGQTKMLLACLLPIVAMSFTKETYFISLLIFWVFQIWICDGVKRLRSAQLFVFSFLCFSLSVLIQVLANSPFINFRAEPGTDYEMSLGLKSMVQTYLIYAEQLLNPWTAAAVVLSLLLCFKKQGKIREPVMLVCMGLAAYIPHAALPNHVSLTYSWIAAMLCLTPLLFIPCGFLQLNLSRVGLNRATLLPVFTSATLILLSLAGVQANEKRYSATQWSIDQEQYNRRILGSFAKLNQLPASTGKILVCGITRPFHPFAVSPFIRRELGENREWTVVIPNGQDEKKYRVAIPLKRECVYFANVDRIDLSSFDYSVGYDDLGHLIAEFDHQALLKAADSDLGTLGEADFVLIPALREKSRVLRRDSSNWVILQQVGIEYLYWKVVDPATEYLQQAIELSKGTNPYPYFYLGQLKEYEQDYAAALQLYQQAVALDVPVSNPAFKQSLERVRSLSNSRVRQTGF